MSLRFAWKAHDLCSFEDLEHTDSASNACAKKTFDFDFASRSVLSDPFMKGNQVTSDAETSIPFYCFIAVR